MRGQIAKICPKCGKSNNNQRTTCWKCKERLL